MFTPKVLQQHIFRASGSAKTICVSSVLFALGIEPNKYHSTSTPKNINNYESIIRRHGFALRSRKSQIKPYSTVGSIRAKIKKFDDPGNAVYLIRLKDHVLLLNKNGDTIADTDKKQRDKRRIIKIHAIWQK
jgi:hypothetical protein